MNAGARSSRPSTSTSNSNAGSASSNVADVPGNVRSLLEATKNLQELLRQWSIGQATESLVSDAYVKVGTDFNATIHAFAYYSIDLSDIHSIPKELRTVLEQCLGEDPSPAVYERYMPEVRKIIYKLLKGLQMRQDAWKATGGRGSYDAR